MFRLKPLSVKKADLERTTLSFQEDRPSMLRQNAWPGYSEILIVALISSIVVWLEIHFSRRVGLLTMPPMMDGAAYLDGAKSAYLTTKASFPHPYLLLRQLHTNWNFLHSPLWVGLMSLSYFAFGEGEWQSYVARFWPTFFLLLLVVWVTGRRYGSALAWCFAAWTAVLPTISPTLTVSASQKPGSPVEVWDLWKADPRPDLLTAVLFVCAAACLFEHVDSVDRKSFLLSGTFAACAVLCKPATAPALVMMWGLAILYVIGMNYRSLRQTISLSFWTLPPFAIVGFYLWKGGYIHIAEYMKWVFSKTVSTWSIANPTISAVLGYYWERFTFHMGKPAWVVLLAGGICFAVSLFRSQPLDRAALGYLVLATGWYIVLCKSPVKNKFLGLNYYLLLWMFSVVALAPFLRWTGRRWGRLAVPAVTFVFLLTMVVNGFHFLTHPPQQQIAMSLHNHSTMEEAGHDLRLVVQPNEFFTAADWCSYTCSAVPYYTLTARGAALPILWEPSSPKEDIPKFIEEQVGKTKVIYVYAGELSEVSRYYYFAEPVAFPFYRQLSQWVLLPTNGYKLHKEYQLTFPGKTVTLQMYVRNKE